MGLNSARLNGRGPETWLADVLEQIVSGSIPVNWLDELLRWNWKADREHGANGGCGGRSLVRSKGPVAARSAAASSLPPSRLMLDDATF
ncbi:transposase domain-containing protein [Mesorhizobium silamurunense]|uniref:transposase domain-containing protein n=1 Tax=Mesorhizobium silamurunense TaxID=499528 RepID=UPI00177F3DC3